MTLGRESVCCLPCQTDSLEMEDKVLGIEVMCFLCVGRTCPVCKNTPPIMDSEGSNSSRGVQQMNFGNWANHLLISRWASHNRCNGSFPLNVSFHVCLGVSPMVRTTACWSL